MKPYTYSAGDYAGFESGKLRCYYGYEQIDQLTEDWCFVVWKNDREVFRVPNHQLVDIAPGGSPLDMLVAGLALYLGK